jgi:adenylate kinase family enzyme
LAKAYFVSGLPGSGKSHFSKKLAKQLDLKIIDFDDNLPELIREHKTEYNKVGSEKFLENYAQQRYDDLIQRAVEQLEGGHSVVIVAPFSKQIKDQKLWSDLIKPITKFDTNPTLYWVVISPETRRIRLTGRGAVRDEQKIANLDEYIKNHPPTPPMIDHTVISGEKGGEKF